MTATIRLPAFLRGVTLRLVAVTSLVVFAGVSLSGSLATYRHHSKLVERKSHELHLFCRDYAPVVVDADLRRALALPRAQRNRALEELRKSVTARFLPNLAHLSLFTAESPPRELCSTGVPLPDLSEEAAAEARRGRAIRTTVHPGADSLLIIATVPLTGRGRVTALVRYAVTEDTFPQFLLRQMRQDAGWIALTFGGAVAISALLVLVLTRSLRSVTTYARAIERGEFTQPIHVHSSDEAGTIADAFNVVLHRLRQNYVSTLGALAALLETKDRTTESHTLRGLKYALELGKAIGLSEQELTDLEYGALVHDIGKIGIGDHILKKTGPLTEEEWTVMRQHPTIGYNALKNLDFLKNALPVVLHHQERWDGRGYPNGLKGEEIPLLARIFAIADSFDAMTSDRPYRRAMRPEAAIREIRRNGGTQFDPKLTEVFVKLWEDGKLIPRDDRTRTEIAAS